MIQLTKSASTTIALTLTEKCTLTNPNYLFEFECNDTGVKEYCIAADTATTAERIRFNKFTITEDSTPNNLNGEVDLPINGWYSYTVYEQASSTNLDPANATGIVEKGKMYLSTTPITVAEYTSTSTTTPTYNG